MGGEAKTTRAAIYTRVSTDHGLEQDFNSLDAQREAAEAYVLSQSGCGWSLVATAYDDGGYSGATLVRPALQRLMDDASKGKIDVVVVYKIDRFSRSLLGFSELMDKLNKYSVGIVSVTQQFNTTTSSGRLMLNLLMSFSSYERDLIGERVRDKAHASRKRGKWIGGVPPLGYDVGKESRRLEVNELEAQGVRKIFDAYCENQSLSRTVAEVRAFGLTQKAYVSAKGERRGGAHFTKTTLHRLLTNYTYIGKVAFQGKVYEGEHEGILDVAVFDKVQGLLSSNRRNGGQRIKNQYGSFLKGLLRCTHCASAMTPSMTKKASGRIYRYYICINAQKNGWKECPSPSLPAGEIESFVLGQLKEIGNNYHLRRAVWKKLNEKIEQKTKEARRAINDLEKQRDGLEKRIRLAIEQNADSEEFVFLEESFALLEKELASLRKSLARLTEAKASEQDVSRALSHFDTVWGGLKGPERCDLVRVLLERVDFDGPKEQVLLQFRSEGIRSLVLESARGENEV